VSAKVVDHWDPYCLKAKSERDLPLILRETHGARTILRLATANAS
jgi:hypothetical protein